MKKLIMSLLISVLLPAAFAAEPDTRVFELRTYYAAPGKLEALHARFRDHTCKLFEKHGMTNIGYWSPIDEKQAETKLVYILDTRRDSRTKSPNGSRS